MRAAIGAAYGTSKAGIGIAGMGTLRPELIMKVRSPSASTPRPSTYPATPLHEDPPSTPAPTQADPLDGTQSLIPVVMAGIIAVYGLVVSVLIVGGLTPDGKYSLYAGLHSSGGGIELWANGAGGGACDWDCGGCGECAFRGCGGCLGARCGLDMRGDLDRGRMMGAAGDAGGPGL